MKKLWTFGCSFTYGNGILDGELYSKIYKKNDNDLLWSKLLANKLNLSLINMGYGGISNETILDKIIFNWNKIEEGDFVIISKTWSHRFDFPKKINSIEPKVIVYKGDDEDVKKSFDELTIGIFDDNQIECIKQFSVNFSSQPLYSNRHDIRFNFIKERLLSDKKVKVCYVWDVESLWHNYEQIRNISNINDSHWSYKGHRDFFEYIFNEINPNIYIKNNKTKKFI